MGISAFRGSPRAMNGSSGTGCSPRRRSLRSTTTRQPATRSAPH